MPEVPRDLTGRSALVVGGTQNMGLAIAENLAARGADLVVSYGHDADAADAAVKRLRDLTEHVEAVSADATASADTTRLWDRAFELRGRVDLVVHLPGMIVKKALADFTDDEFDQLMIYNARTAFLTLREAERRVADDGRVVVLSTSLTGMSMPLYGAYVGSKAAAEAMVRSAAREVASRRITVNAVTPGPVDTRFFHGQETPESQAAVVSFTPMGRLGTPSDVVPLVGFLLGAEAGWITGQVLRPNGGLV